ncbi:MAG: toxin-antitoxin system YwqK family antitoxin [bacterium]|nr:toxin-antitoxin system YwqK family antitoxin [bacterium]
MNPVPFILLAISLPLLLGGCGEKESVGEVKPEPVAIDIGKLEYRGGGGYPWNGGIAYLKGSDTPYTGKSFLLYKNGQKKSEGNWKNGKQDGLWVTWYKNGNYQTAGKMKDGKEDGLSTHWYENGQREVQGNYKNGKLNGLREQWHENGQKMFETNWKDGEILPARKYWNSKGEPVDSLEEAEAK